MRDYSRLLAAMAEEHRRRSPRCAALQERALRVMVDGGSHTIRLVQPFPPRIARAQGAWLTDADGHDILDFWQGHFANLLGHNPAVITRALAEAFAAGRGLHTGLADELQVEVAELLCRLTGAERVRFTTSGALATMYAIMLACAHTGRSQVLKVGGGWHGAQPWALKGVGYRGGFSQVDSAGLPARLLEDVLITRFNDPDDLEATFRRSGERIACFIVEPFIGAGGFLPARRDYLQAARELCTRHGALLVLDEVISGFRFRAGDAGSLYAVKPDLAIYGKVMGGGMPVAAVAGRADVLDLVSVRAGRVKFSGGTYSAHPAAMLAARTMMTHLAEHEAEIYPRLAALGDLTRRTMERAFQEEGIDARCTGYSNEAISGSSIAAVRFPQRPGIRLETPEDVHDPALCDDFLSERVLRLALLLEDVHTVHGLGALSTAHSEADIAFLGEACRRAARRIRPYL